MRKITVFAATLALAASFNVAAGSNVAQAIADAKAANKKAKSVGYEWRDTGKIIKKAEAAAKKGDTDKALSLAHAAQTQAVNAYHQYNEQKNVLPHY